MTANFDNILSAVRSSAEKRIIFLPHAIRQMGRPERSISTADIRSVIFEGEIIEDYPEDQLFDARFKHTKTGNTYCLFAKNRASCNYHGIFAI